MAMDAGWGAMLRRARLSSLPLLARAAATTLHGPGLAMLFGAVPAFGLRTLTVAARDLPAGEPGGFLLAVARVGLGLAVASGLVLPAADAAQCVGNPAFHPKAAQARAALMLAAPAKTLAFRALAGGRRRPAPRPRPWSCLGPG